jgi:hypothetical protein
MVRRSGARAAERVGTPCLICSSATDRASGSLRCVDPAPLKHRLEHCDARVIAQERVDAALDVVQRIVLDPASVEVVITGALVKTMRTWRPKYAAHDRLGSVEGSVAEKPDGDWGIALACYPFLGPAPDSKDIRHTAAHEAFHVVTGQRGEKLDDLAEQQSRGQAQLLATVVAQVVEEYRVERAALEFGTGPDEARRESLEVKLRECRQLLRAAARGDRRQAELNTTLREAFSVFRDLAREIAWIAAADLATDGAVRLESNSPAWKRLVGPHYAVICDGLSLIPSASIECPREQLKRLSEALIPLFVQWLTFIGVFTRDDDEVGAVRLDWLRTDF